MLDVAGADPAGGVADRSVLGSRLCHELAHSWFGLAIGARDWTEEWISEGFATYLEDVIWAKAQEVGYSGNMSILRRTWVMCEDVEYYC